jgi:hypothetical protein
MPPSLPHPHHKEFLLASGEAPRGPRAGACGSLPIAHIIFLKIPKIIPYTKIIFVNSPTPLKFIICRSLGRLKLRQRYKGSCTVFSGHHLLSRSITQCMSSNLPVPTQFMDLTADPASLGWPPALPVELALQQQPVKEICEAYGIDRYEYDRLRNDPAFRRAVALATETLREEGASFKLKARAQSEELLKTSWALIHKPLDQVSASVKAQLIMFTVRCAGLDASVEQKARAQVTANAAALTALTINLHLGD